jgi:hypothetical protein
VTSRRPPSYDDPEAPPDSLTNERTLIHGVQDARGGDEGGHGGRQSTTDVTTTPVNVVLERGVDSQGSTPMSFLGGTQQGPISMGRAGQFRIDGRGVLATHAYLMFDGDGVHLCSADEANPVTADGVRIPREWTPVAVPCTLVFGRTRAVLRNASTAAPARPVPHPPPRARVSFEVSASPDEATEAAYVLPRSGNDAPTPFSGVPTAVTYAPSVEPPREPYRPRFPSQSDDESTRMNTDVLAQSAIRIPTGDDESTRMNPTADLMRPPTAYPNPQPATRAAPLAVQSYVPPLPPGFMPSPAQAAGATPYDQGSSGAPFEAPTGYPPEPTQAPQAYAAGPGLGFGGAPPPATVSPPMPGGPRTPSPLTRALESLRVAMQPGSPRRQPLLLGACTLVALFVITLVTVIRLHAARGPVASNLPPVPVPVPTASAAPVATAGVTSGIVVYPAPARVEVDAGVEPSPAKGRKGKAAEPVAATLERTAVDAVNRGDLNGALGLYRQLAQQQPDNPAFANAARLIQIKLGAANGSP